MPQARCIWQLPGWPKLRFDVAAASPALLRARERQGQVRGIARAVGLDGMHERQRQLIRRLLEAGDGGLGGVGRRVLAARYALLAACPPFLLRLG